MGDILAIHMDTESQLHKPIQVLMLMEMEFPTLLFPTVLLFQASELLIILTEDSVTVPSLHKPIQVLMLMEMEFPTLLLPILPVLSLPHKSDHLSFMVEL